MTVATQRGNLSGLRLATFEGAPIQPTSASAENERQSLSEAILALELRAYDAGENAVASSLKRERLGMNRVPAGRPGPVDLWQRHEAPELPLGVLPTVIEDFALTQGDVMGADPAGLALSALAVCAAAMNDEIQVQVKQHDPTWRESARLWVGLVGLPSTKKTPVMSAAMRPLRGIDREMASRNARAIAEWQRLDKRARDTTPMPSQPRRVVEDATVEALQEVLKDSPHGVISMQDELSGWFGAMDKYSPGKGGAADRGFWLKSFNGGAYSVNRIARGAIFVPNLSVGLLGGIQPEPLRKLAGDSVDDGLIQRFIPVVLRPATLGRDAPVGTAVASYEVLIEELTRLRASRSGNLGQPEPIKFSPEASAIREGLEAENCELILAIETVSPKLASHLGKHDGIFARLALLWHCIEHVGVAVPPLISGDVAERVARFMRDFLRPSAIAFYAGLLGMSAGHEDLMALASVIVSGQLTEVGARDVQRSAHSLRHVTADDARRLCEKLEAFGWLDPTEPRAKSNSPRWRVVPAVHTLFAERGLMEAERRSRAREAFAASLGGRGAG